MASPSRLACRSMAAMFGRAVPLGGVLARTVVLALAFIGLAQAQNPGAYQIDPQASRIEIHVFRGGFLASLGDNHVIHLTRFSGTTEGTRAGVWQVHVIGEAASLKVMDPGASDSTRQTVQEKMLGPAQMDVARYPTIELRARSVLPGDDAKSWRMLADVTVHGVTRQVEFPLAWSQNGDQLRVQGERKLMLRDFGIEPIRIGLGAVKVRNEFELTYDIALRSQ